MNCNFLNCCICNCFMCLHTQPRKSSRSSKGKPVKPPSPFNWTPNGMTWTVKSKLVILCRQIGGARLHVMPRAGIKRSGIPYAEDRFHLSQGIFGAGKILAEYKVDIISIYDADNLEIMVCSLHCSVFKFEHLACAQQLFDIFPFKRVRPLMSSVSEIPSGALIRPSRINTLLHGVVCRRDRNCRLRQHQVEAIRLQCAVRDG